LIRPEKYQYNWKPKTKSKEDLELVRNLEKLTKELNVNKTQLTRMALVKYISYLSKPVRRMKINGIL